MCSKHGIAFIQRVGGGIINHNSSWIIKPVVIKLKERCRFALELFGIKPRPCPSFGANYRPTLYKAM